MIFFFSCTIVPEQSQNEQLAKASTEVIFASIEPLGSHRFQSKVRRKELRDMNVVSSHDELVEVEWQDWDNFRYTRTIDTKEVHALIVHHHIPWFRTYAKPWKQYEDAEPYRLQLRSGWNTWEQYLGTYEKQLSWRVLEETQLEGRPVTRYELTLGSASMPAQQNLTLTSLTGSVTVDSSTATRLYTEVKMVLSSENYTKEIDIQLKRTDIGRPIEITPPELE